MSYLVLACDVLATSRRRLSLARHYLLATSRRRPNPNPFLWLSRTLPLSSPQPQSFSLTLLDSASLDGRSLLIFLLATSRHRSSSLRPHAVAPTPILSSTLPVSIRLCDFTSLVPANSSSLRSRMCSFVPRRALTRGGSLHDARRRPRRRKARGQTASAERQAATSSWAAGSTVAASRAACDFFRPS
jgi:hypothetical protein